MGFAAQELLRDNLATPQNVKFIGAFPTTRSAGAPLGRPRRGAATVARVFTPFFAILRSAVRDSQSPRWISARNAFCETRFVARHRETHVDAIEADLRNFPCFERAET